jgi:hypothetical protein
MLPKIPWCRPPVAQLLRPVGNGALIIGGNRPVARVDSSPPRPESSLLRVHVDRHAAPRGAELTFGSLNIRSLGNKLDDLLDVRRDQSLDVMCLVETWHDSDSVCLRRLRVDGMQVVDRPRPRIVVNRVTTNHGGVAIVAMPGVRLSQLDVGVKPTTFEHVCARAASGPSACITAVIYRAGSAAVTATFFDELSDLSDRLATLVEPIYVVGDCNVRTDRPMTRPRSGFATSSLPTACPIV